MFNNILGNDNIKELLTNAVKITKHHTVICLLGQKELEKN